MVTNLNQVKAAADDSWPVKTPPPPYYAVVFVGRLKSADLASYMKCSQEMTAKAKALDGFFGEDALRLEDNRIISVSYWRDLESIQQWRADSDHVAAKRRGREQWYDYYELRITKVEQVSSFAAADDTQRNGRS